MKPTSESSSPTPAQVLSSVTLEIKGGIPSFKNTKRAILDRKTGRMRTLTPGQIKDRMRQIEADFASELFSALQTGAGVISTAASLRSWIASVMPADDSWQDVPEITISGELNPSNPGATVTIERIG